MVKRELPDGLVEVFSVFSDRYSVDAGFYSCFQLPKAFQKIPVVQQIRQCDEFALEVFLGSFGYKSLFCVHARPVSVWLDFLRAQSGLMDVLSVVTLSDSFPEEICLIGIRLNTIELGLDMTPEMWDKVNILIDRVVGKLREGKVPCVLRSPQESSP